MENASKALLIAGGVLLTILVLSSLIYGWNIYTEYQTEQLRLEEIDNVAKFNRQFDNYNRDDINGYELLSLANKVVDYNQRESEMGSSTDSTAGNKVEFEPITLIIDMTNVDESNILMTSIEVPKVSGSVTIPISSHLIEAKTYELSVDSSIRGNFDEILNNVKNIEGMNTVFGRRSRTSKSCKRYKYHIYK